MIKGAVRLAGYEKPTVWTKFGALAAQTQPTNLGQGFPGWNPPNFFLEALEKANQDVSQQYTRAYGTPRLCQTISDFYSPIYNRTLDPNTNVLVANGGVACLNAIFMGLINPGDEVILLDPSYDCYAAQIQMAGGVSRSVPLKPRTLQTKQDVLNKSNRYQFTDNDLWEIDYDLLKQNINDKTKAIVINSPHNPTGKIFSQKEYENIADLIRDKNILVVEDQVYEHLTFENYKPFENPRMAKVDGMFDRCINVSSAGKLFSATGIRVGWAIGPADLMKYCMGFHQYNVFCMHGPTQEAVAISLEKSKENGFFEEQNEKMIQLRNQLIDGLVEGSQDFHIWIPQGGYFILCDISKLPVQEKYYKNELFSDYVITKDLAYCFESAHEKSLLPIPCSIFYQPETKSQGENLVRFAFCKEKEMLEEAALKFKNA